MSSQYVNLPSVGAGSWKSSVATAGVLPVSGNSLGDARIDISTDTIYIWTGSSWVAVATPGAAIAIDGLIGDITASGPGVVPATLSATGVVAGSHGSATQVGQFTVDAKGRILSASDIAIQIAESQVTNLVSDLAGKQSVGNYITALTGDANASGPGSAAIVLATTNVSPGTFGSVSSVPIVTVNAKGLSTSVSSTPIQIAESQVTNLVSDLAGKQATGNYVTSLTGDVSASGPGAAAAVVNSVAGKSAAEIAQSVTDTQAATNLNTVSTIVKRDGVGNFAAGTISANLTGLASNATTSVSFSGSLSGNVTGTQNSTAISDTTVTNKILTGYAVGANTVISAADSILLALGKVQGQLNATSGSAITSLTEDAVATGPGVSAIILATVNGSPGTFGSVSSVPVVTVNAKGLATSVSSTPIQIAESQVTNLVSDLAGKQPVGNYITVLTGDVSTAGPGSSSSVVNSVGGQSAAAVAAATILVESAYSGNVVLASPANGSSGIATFRSLVGADFTGSFTAGSVIFAGATGALSQNNSNFFWDNTNSRLGIGTTIPADSIHSSALGINRITIDAYGAGASPVFNGRMAQGTVLLPSAVLSGNGLLSLSGKGYNGSAFTASSAANISFLANENWSATATGAYIKLSTVANGTTLLTEAMRVNSTGNVLVGTIIDSGLAQLQLLSTTQAQLGLRYDSNNYTRMTVASNNNLSIMPNTNQAGGANNGSVLLSAANGFTPITNGNGAIGGTLNLQGGIGGANNVTGAPGSGGPVVVAGGAAAAAAGSAGGAASISGSAGTAVGSGGPGGNLVLAAGNATGDNTVSRTGGSVTVTAGNSFGNSVGAAINVTAGAGAVGLTTTGSAGGAIALTSGIGGNGSATGGAGGAMNITAGTAGTGGTTSGNGGAMTLSGGAAAAAAASNGGGLTLTGNNGSSVGSGGAGGGVTVNGGNAGGDNTVSRSGGNINITSGLSVGSAASAQINIIAGIGGVGTGTAGAVGGGTTILGGLGGAGSATSGSGGAITLRGGAGGAGVGGATGGGATVQGGAGGVGSTTGGNGGAATIAGGTAAAVAGTSGGLVSITGGASAAVDNSNAGGVAISGSAGSAVASGGSAGGVTITGGNAGGDNTVSRAGGALNFTAGLSKGSSAGGALSFLAGTGGIGTATAGAGGGNIVATAGTGGAGSATSGSGGSVSLAAGVGGAGVVAGNGGPFTLAGGAGGIGSTTPGNGGTITINGGAAAASAGSAGGIVTIQAAAGTAIGSGGAGGGFSVSGGNAGGDNTINRAGGNISAVAGLSKGDSVGGAVTITSGAGGLGTVATGAAGGVITITPGAGGLGSTTGGAGGGIQINGGLGGNSTTPGAGGTISFRTAATTAITVRGTVTAAGNWGFGNNAAPTYLVDVLGGNVGVATIGNGYRTKEGANAKQGVATLVAGTVTIANTNITATSRVFLTAQSLGTVVLPQALAVTARVAATSFTITSASATDTSVIAYEIFEPY